MSPVLPGTLQELQLDKCVRVSDCGLDYVSHHLTGLTRLSLGGLPEVGGRCISNANMIVEKFS